MDAALDLAWTHWTGLGVRGATKPPDTAVDPEALICFTMALAEHDPRLLEEAGDWWARFQRFVSRPRLTTLTKNFSPEIAASLETFEKRYLGSSNVSGKSRVDRLDHPSRSLLRLRCFFGGNARAEIVLALLTEWQDTRGVTALALSEVGFSKRSVATILEELTMAGVVSAASEANRLSYRLVDRQALQRVLAPLPAIAGKWHLRLPIVASYLELEDRLGDTDRDLKAVEGRKLLETWKASLEALGLSAPSGVAIKDYWTTLQRWLIRSVITHGENESRHLDRMIQGMWIRPKTKVFGRPLTFTNAVLPALTTDPSPNAEMLCLDLVQGPLVDRPGDWRWEVLTEEAIANYEHSSGLARGEPWRFVYWDGDRLREYNAAFTKTIDRALVQRRYGGEAAISLPERGAVQLRMSPAFIE